jgi:vesicle-associated membrane protein 72|tara:strand:- start:9991 stop:10635 length:645 start_codon:yes stop_codon:yes gene_type:complete
MMTTSARECVRATTTTTMMTDRGRVASTTQALEKLSDDNTRFTYTADGHTFNYVVENGFTYLVVADSEVGRHVPFACLDRIKGEFTRDHASEAQDAIAHSLNKSFAPRLKEHLEFCSANPDSVSKVSQVQQQVSQVKEIMMDNIEKVLDRGEKIEILVDKSDALRFQADNFHKTGRQLRRKLWCENMKMKALVGIVLLALLLTLIFTLCGKKCR